MGVCIFRHRVNVRYDMCFVDVCEQRGGYVCVCVCVWVSV